MSTIVTIASGDLISNSRADLNTNFSNLNSDKIETSYLDTDTSLAANSDVKIATQKAVKTYIDTSGGTNASETARGIVEEATDAEVTAGTATGATGAKLFITPAKLATASGETGVSKIVKTKSTGLLDSSIVPGLNQYLGVGSSTNTLFWNRVYQWVNPADTTNDLWTVVTGTPIATYVVDEATGVAVGGAISTAPLSILETRGFNKDISIEFAMKIATAGTPSVAGTEGCFVGFGETNDFNAMGDDTLIGGAATADVFGIRVDNSDGKIYARNSNGGTLTDTEITGITIANLNTYRIDFDAGVDIKFYVNGTLKATHTTNLPNATTQIYLGLGSKNATNCYYFGAISSFACSFAK